MNLDLSTIQNTALWVLIGIAVVALLLAIVIKKVIGKVITLILAAAILFFGWQQRSKVIDFADNLKGQVCTSQPTYFGIKINFPGC